MPDMTDEQRKQLEEKIKKMSPEELKEFQKQQCIFCQIISGKIPSKKVYSDDKCIAVMDINPATKGHVLIMPKEHYAIMPQIPDKEIGHLFLVSKYLSQVVLKTLKVSGTNIFVANGGIAGQRAQHFMIHLIPRKEGDKILEIEEKLIDAQIITKVKELVQPKLHALLGVKIEKQTTLPQEKIELPEEEIVVGKRDHPEELLDVPEEVEEVEEEKPKKKSSSKVKKVVTKEPKTVSKKNPPKKEEVALDDIADLFK
ncbi:MAG: HIT domain-containing protein [Candidatus Woesearchaeota archaeon]